MRELVPLLRGSDRNIVPGILVDLSSQHVQDFETHWMRQLRDAKAEDKYWDWRFKQRITNRYQGQYEAYAVEFENLTQGLLLLETERHRSFFERGQRLVYVEAVSVAPWNRIVLTSTPQFRGIGTVLLDFAQQRSLELGYGGRVGLESLPAAVGFYESRDMVRLDPNPDEEYIDPNDEPPLPYFEHLSLSR